MLTATAVSVVAAGSPASLAAAPPLATPVFIAHGGVPFEGPYSLIDIPGFAAQVTAALLVLP